MTAYFADHIIKKNMSFKSTRVKATGIITIDDNGDIFQLDSPEYWNESVTITGEAIQLETVYQYEQGTLTQKRSVTRRIELADLTPAEQQAILTLITEGDKRAETLHT